ncbi:MAG: sensor histidine kinase [Waterburya sp.]
MILPADLRSHPLKFLLKIEWIILVLLAVIEAIPAIEVKQLLHLPGLNIVGMIAFFLLGLRLPKRFVSKLFYLFLEVGLVLLLSCAGGVRLFQLLFIVIVMRNCTLFKGWSNIFVTTAVYFLYAIIQLNRLSNTFPAYTFPLRGRVRLAWLSLLLLFGFIVVFLQMLVRVVLQERQGREQLEIANNQLRQYALRIEDQATLQERNRIAREIHDSLGHSLTAFNLHLEAVIMLFETDPAEAKALLSEAKQIGSQALQDVRQSVSALRSGSDLFQGRSLEAALLDLIRDFERSTGIKPKLVFPTHLTLNSSLNVAIYRIVQEALTNICKYAQATKVEITMETLLEAQPILQMSIRDNGQGFDLNQTRTGFGLQGMQERTSVLSGTIQIITAPQQGCQIIARFPMHLT